MWAAYGSGALLRQAAESLSDVQNGGHDAGVVHAHRSENGDLGVEAAGHFQGQADDGKIVQGGMDIGQADVQLNFIAGAFEELIEQGDEAFLLLERAEQVAQTFLGEVQVEADEIGSALHEDQGRQTDVEQALVVEHGQAAQQGIVGRGLETQQALDLEADATERPSGEITVQVVADGSEFVLRGEPVELSDLAAHHVVAGDNDHQDAGRRQEDELDLIEHLAMAGNGGGDADVARELGKQVRGVLGAGVSALLGICTEVTYEGQAAIELETAATGAPARRYSYHIRDGAGALSLDVCPMIREIVEERERGVSVAVIAAQFHATLADLVARVCCRVREERGVCQVALSGGVFQNVLLLGMVLERLQQLDFRVARHRLAPCNDGGLSLGQAAVAARRYKR